MKFDKMAMHTTRTDDIMTTRLVLGSENPIIIETPLNEELAVVKHLDSIKDILEETVNKYLK